MGYTIEAVKAELRKNLEALKQRESRLKIQEAKAARLAKQPLKQRACKIDVASPIQSAAEVMGPPPALSGPAPMSAPRAWYIYFQEVMSSFKR